jgi:hypothetical protein
LAAHNAQWWDDWTLVAGLRDVRSPPLCYLPRPSPPLHFSLPAPVEPPPLPMGPLARRCRALAPAPAMAAQVKRAKLQAPTPAPSPPPHQTDTTPRELATCSPDYSGNTVVDTTATPSHFRGLRRSVISPGETVRSAGPARPTWCAAPRGPLAAPPCPAAIPNGRSTRACLSVGRGVVAVS